MSWKDISSFSKNDKDRTPTTFELQAGDVRLVVTRHIHHPGAWVAICEPFFRCKELDCEDIERAKEEAITVVRHKLGNSLCGLPVIAKTPFCSECSGATKPTNRKRVFECLECGEVEHLKPTREDCEKLATVLKGGKE